MFITPVNIKGFLYTEDFRSMHHVHQDKCVSIEKYDFTLSKSRTDDGVPRSAVTSGSILNITLSIGSRNSMKVFYERLKDMQLSAYSVFFDSKFDDDNYLEDYGSAFVLKGYVVNICEDYKTSLAKDEKDTFTISMQILISKLTVLGNGKEVVFIS